LLTERPGIPVVLKASSEPTLAIADDVAESHARSGVRDISAPEHAELATGWLQVPPASGIECAQALRRAGLVVQSETSEKILLRDRNGQIVSVPLVERLPPEGLVAILRAAGVSPARFTQYLDDVEG
jgi:hypothetical protein